MNENTISTLEQGQASAKGQFDKTMSGLKDGINNATAGVEQAQATMRDGMGKVMKTAEDMMTFSQGNLEALTKSSQIFATGMQDLSQGWAAMARASMDDMMGTMRAMTSVKSTTPPESRGQLPEAFEAARTYGRAARVCG